MASEFDIVLKQYKASLLEYKVSGESVFKRQADNAEKWLNDYISSLNTSIRQDANRITEFARNYENTNPDLVKYAKQIAEVREKGPKLQDIYEGEKESQAELPIDESQYYTKAAAVGGILALAAVVSFL
jgi:cell shape-determining protein MreC